MKAGVREYRGVCGGGPVPSELLGGVIRSAGQPVLTGGSPDGLRVAGRLDLFSQAGFGFFVAEAGPGGF